MSSDTPFVEYLIIGAHASAWVILVILWLFGISPTVIMSIDPAQLVLGLPFIYLIGMLFDDVVHYPLDPIRKRIRNKIYDPKVCKDELIAFASENLYSAYEARVRRVRIIGAAIFNWPLLGISILMHIGFANPIYVTPVVSFTVVLLIISCMTWYNLYRRAYEFRKKACDIILENQKDENSVHAKNARPKSR